MEKLGPTKFSIDRIHGRHQLGRAFALQGVIKQRLLALCCVRLQGLATLKLTSKVLALLVCVLVSGYNNALCVKKPTKGDTLINDGTFDGTSQNNGLRI